MHGSGYTEIEEDPRTESVVCGPCLSICLIRTFLKENKLLSGQSKIFFLQKSTELLYFFFLKQLCLTDVHCALR